MAGEDVISRIKEAEIKAASVIADAERKAEEMRAEGAAEAADIVKSATAESRRSYETAMLLEKQKIRQEKEELVKAGKKRIYVEEEAARSRIKEAVEQLYRRLEDYIHAQAP